MSDPVIPPYVRDFAAQHRLDLSKVRTESGRAMSCLDISAFAKQRGDADLQTLALAAQFRWNAGGLTKDEAARAATSSGSRRQLSPVDVMARNPLVAQIRAQAMAGEITVPTSPAPALFANGDDLPTFTASGISPTALLEVPWEARHAMAAAATTAEAYAIQADVQENGNNPLEYADHPGNADYRQRVAKWQASVPWSDAEWEAAAPVMTKLVNRAEEDIAALDAQARKRLGL